MKWAGLRGGCGGLGREWGWAGKGLPACMEPFQGGAGGKRARPLGRRVGQAGLESRCSRVVRGQPFLCRRLAPCPPWVSLIPFPCPICSSAFCSLPFAPSAQSLPLLSASSLLCDPSLICSLLHLLLCCLTPPPAQAAQRMPMQLAVLVP